MITPLQLAAIKPTVISLSKGMALGAVWLGAITLDEHALVPVGSVVVIVGIAIRYGMVAQRFRDRIETLEREVKELRQRRE